MANRHLARSIAMQSLYEWDFHNKKASELDEVIERNILEFGPGLSDEDKGFASNLTTNVVKKRATLDSIVEKAAHDWPIAQTPITDRNALRIGLYELLYAPKDEVPARVAINESIELAKKFGGDKSGKFVNGVLGTIYKEMGEPGKDEKPKKKNNKKELTAEEIEKLPVVKKVGAVVYNIDKGKIWLAFVHDIFGRWTLSKGGVEKGETDEEAVIREMKEEMNLGVSLKEKIGSNEFIANDPEKGKLRKQVTYYLAESNDRDGIRVGESGGLDDARWFGVDEVEGLKMYGDIRPLIDKAVAILTEKK